MLYQTTSTWERLCLSCHPIKTTIKTFSTLLPLITESLPCKSVNLVLVHCSASHHGFVRNTPGRDHRWNSVTEHLASMCEALGSVHCHGNMQKHPVWGLWRAGQGSFLTLPGYKWQGDNLWHQGNGRQISPKFKRTRKHLGMLVTILFKNTAC